MDVEVGRCLWFIGYLFGSWLSSHPWQPLLASLGAPWVGGIPSLLSEAVRSVTPPGLCPQLCSLPAPVLSPVTPGIPSSVRPFQGKRSAKVGRIQFIPGSLNNVISVLYIKESQTAQPDFPMKTFNFY